MNQVFLSIGSNVGDRSFYLSQGIACLEKRAGTVTSRSGVYETEPWGCEAEITFYNQVIELRTTLEPLSLLEIVHDIERSQGRDHSAPRFAPRTLDIDILFFDGLIFSSPLLVIPHPFISERKFVLVPLAEIAGSFLHPVYHKKVSELLAFCTDPMKILQRIS